MLLLNVRNRVDCVEEVGSGAIGTRCG